jgi:WD40 repeat protein
MTPLNRHPRVVVLLVLLLIPHPAHAQMLTKAQVARLGKAATALVEMNKGQASGSAFCIHPSGLFITNDHVVRGSGQEIRLVLDSGLPTQKEIQAMVVRTDRQLDLALLRAAGDRSYPALALGSEENISELDEVVAFGFPFGKTLTVDKDSFPSVTVNAGNISALRRKKGGTLERIQLDARVNPGCSGGPVLDLSGKVIGVVVSGFVARGLGTTGINFAIPVSHVARFVARPDIQFTPPELNRSNVHGPLLFQARAASLLPSARPLALELILAAEERQKKYPMELAGGIYRVKAVPLEPRENLRVLACTVVAFQDGKEVGRRSETVAVQGVGNDGLGIKPPTLDQDKVVQRLPAPVADLAMGGGGRFLVLHCPALGHLAVFDINKARITHRIPVANDVQFAAGLDKLLVVSPSQDLVQRYSLRTGEEEASGPLPIRGVILGLAMGSASEGPVLVHWAESGRPMSRSHYTMCAPEDLRPLPWGQVDGPAYLGPSWGQGRSALRASPEGTLFLLRGFETLLLVDKVSWPGTTASPAWLGYALPGPGGNVLYTAAGQFTSEFKRVSDSWLEMYSLIPAQVGGYYLALPFAYDLGSFFAVYPKGSSPLERAPGIPGLPPGVGRDGVALCSADNNQLLSILPGTDLPAPLKPGVPNDFTYDKRIHLIPAARLIVTFPDNERLILHRLRPEALELRGPWVSSKPSATAECGTTYRYQIEARSQDGGIEYRLEAGPPGLTLSRSGLIEWPVPDHLGPAAVHVRLSVRDTARRSCEHRFTIFVDEGSPLVTIPADMPRSVVLSADGRRLAGVPLVTGRTLETLVWDVETGRAINRFGSRGPSSRIAISADGRRLAGESPLGVTVWDVDTGKRIFKLELRDQKAFDPLPTSFAFSSDGKRLAVHPRRDFNFNRPLGVHPPTELNLWDVATGRLVATLRGGNAELGWISFSPDAKRLAATFGGSLNVCDAADGKELLTLDLPPGSSVSWSPDSKHLALAYLDRAKIGDAQAVRSLPLGAHVPNRVKILDAATGKEVLRSPAHDLMTGWSQTPDRERFLYSSRSGKVIYNARTGLEVVLPPRLDEEVFSPDGTLLAARSPEGVKVCNTATGDEILRLLDPPAEPDSRPVGFTGPRGNLLVVVSRRAIRVWELGLSNDRPVVSRSGAGGTSTQAAGKVIYKLAAPVADVAVGGGGRHLLLHLPQLHQLTIFDVNAAAVIGHIPINEGEARFAAGLEHVVVLLPGAGTIERWSLKTCKREVAAALPLKGAIKAVAMGSASHGPLLVHRAAGTEELSRASFALIDLETLKVLGPEFNMPLMFGGWYRNLIHLRASANGKVFGAWCTSHTPSGVAAIVLSDAGVQSYYGHWSAGHVVPSPQGNVLFTQSGMYPPDKLTNTPQDGDAMVPACHGDFYLSLPRAANVGSVLIPRAGAIPAGERQRTGKPSPPTLHALGKDGPVATLPELDLPESKEEWLKHDFTFDKRIVLVPDAGRLITIPASNDRLILYRLKAAAKGAKTDADHSGAVERKNVGPGSVRRP